MRNPPWVAGVTPARSEKAALRCRARPEVMA